MAGVYSTRLIDAPSFTGGAEPVLVVAPDKLCVIKCITIVYGDIVASGLDAWLQFPSLTKLVRYTWGVGFGGNPNIGGVQQWWGMWVVDPGETVEAQTATGTCDFHASGYLLELP